MGFGFMSSPGGSAPDDSNKDSEYRSYKRTYTLLPILDKEYNNKKEEINDKKDNKETEHMATFMRPTKKPTSRNEHNIKIGKDIFMSVIDVATQGGLYNPETVTGYIIIKSRKRPRTSW